MMANGVPLRYEERPSWPPLAWVARCPGGGGPVTVQHGSRVETRADWFCEAVWDAPFADGDFDRTAVVTGSGGRRRDGSVVFVSSFATVDRLQAMQTEEGAWVSNSLAALLASTGAAVDPTYPDYLYDFRSITRGIDDYHRWLETDAGRVELVYCRDLTWDGSSLTSRDKPDGEARFDDFESYRRYLSERLAAVAENLRSPERDRPLEWVGTLSSGYDSSAVCALAREVGLSTAVSFTRDRHGHRDSGEEVGRHLGLDVLVRPTDRWREMKGIEVPVLAGGATGGEIYMAGARDVFAGSLVLTGQAGVVWRTGEHHELMDSTLSRGDPSGISLTEYRLWAGFLRLPVPFIGARRADVIHQITMSEEMRPWARGGYVKPIPRRICEEAGIPAEAFGQGKYYGALSLGSKDTFWDAPTVDDYLAWIRSHRGAWCRRGRPPPLLVSRVAAPGQWLARNAARLTRPVESRLPGPNPLSRKLEFLGSREYLYKFMFPWALERAKARYLSPGDE